MPDPDQGQSAAPVVDDAEAAAVFSAAAATGGKTAGETPAPVKPTETPPAAATVDKTDAKPTDAPAKPTAEASETPPAAAKTAQDEAEARARQLEQEQAAAAVKAEADRIQKEREDAAKAASPTPAGAVDFNQVEKVIREDLKDLKLTLVNEAGETVEGTIADFEKEGDTGFGEIARNSTRVAIAAAYKIAERMTADLRQQIQEITTERQQAQAKAAQDAYLATVAEQTDHKDVADIVASEAFWEWHAKQSPALQKLIGPGSTIKDNDFYLRAYKEATGYKLAEPGAARSAGREAMADAQRRARKDSDALHRATARGNGSRPADSGNDVQTEEDAQRIFREAAKSAGR